MNIMIKKTLGLVVLGTFIVFNTFSQHHKAGLEIDDIDYLNTPRKALIYSYEGFNLPDSISLKKYTPPVGNQMNLSTSVGWAIGYAARTILTAKDIDDTVAVRNLVYSPIFPYYFSKLDGDHCFPNAKLGEALWAMKNFGIPKYSDFLEFCPREIDNSILEIAKANTIDGFARLFEIDSNPDQKIRAIKKAISEGSPVMAGMHIPESFYNAKEFWSPREDYNDKIPGHALVVIGYNDLKFGGAFEILNSWGKNWGNNGFMWVPYNYFVEFTRYAFEMYDFSWEDDQNIGGEISIKIDPTTKQYLKDPQFENVRKDPRYEKLLKL